MNIQVYVTYPISAIDGNPVFESFEVIAHSPMISYSALVGFGHMPS